MSPNRPPRPVPAASRPAATLLLVLLLLAGCAAPSVPTPTAPASGGPSGSPATAAPNATPGAPSIAPGAGLRLSCGNGHGFPAGLLSQPAGAEGMPHPAAEALRAFLAQGLPEADFLPRSGWLLAGADAAKVTFVARVPGDPPFVQAVVEQKDGRWTVGGWSQCRPRPDLGRLGIASWTFDPAAPRPGPDARRFRALVTEMACASGRSAEGRVAAPVIVYGLREVVVVFGVVPLPGGQDCQGNPPTPVEVELDEPLGGRRLLDGSSYPPRDPDAAL